MPKVTTTIQFFKDETGNKLYKVDSVNLSVTVVKVTRDEIKVLKNLYNKNSFGYVTNGLRPANSKEYYQKIEEIRFRLSYGERPFD